ncbi:DEAD/DEAH box helicase [bacterium]|nr:DEAD/DEAH box helicase [bacterium]
MNNEEDANSGGAPAADDTGLVGSVETFAELKLRPELLANITRLGWTRPSPVQEKVIPVALSGQDLYGIAQTGTGKTGAFALPILQALIDREPARPLKPQAVILAPTRELVQQITEQVQALAELTNVRAVAVYGGVSDGPQISALNEGREVVVAAPGRLLDLMQHGWMQFDDLTHVVLDEADRMFDMGFILDLSTILNRMPARRQTLMMTATLTPAIKKLTTDFMFYPEEIRIGRTKPPSRLKHNLLEVSNEQKDRALAEVLDERDWQSVIIFCRTKKRTDDLARSLARDNRKVASLHADRIQSERQEALNRFKEGKLRILVATDVASRGLDIDSVELVVNFDVPTDPEDYVHRVGRTARAGESGLALTLADRSESRGVQRIERFIGERILRFGEEAGNQPGAAPREESSGGGGRGRSGRGRGGRGRSGGSARSGEGQQPSAENRSPAAEGSDSAPRSSSRRRRGGRGRRGGGGGGGGSQGGGA